MRARILTWPLMVAAVLTLIWRQVPSVCELARMLNRQDKLMGQSHQSFQTSPGSKIFGVSGFCV